MDAETRQRLIETTQQFYDRIAPQFAESRTHGWPGWSRVVSHFPNLASKCSLLDLGCGEGRFLRFLESERWRPRRYVGVDGSSALLDVARERNATSVDTTWDCRTLCEELNDERTFEVVVCFGVLHHVPGKHERQQFIEQLLRKVADNGLLAVSIWQPHTLKNFHDKCKRNHAFGALESGDYIMGWSDNAEVERYVHVWDESEITSVLSMVSALGCRVADRFDGNGSDASNHYIVIKRALRPAHSCA